MTSLAVKNKIIDGKPYIRCPNCKAYHPPENYDINNSSYCKACKILMLRLDQERLIVKNFDFSKKYPDLNKFEASLYRIFPDGTVFRKCSACELFKPLSAFDHGGQKERRCYCKSCALDKQIFLNMKREIIKGKKQNRKIPAKEIARKKKEAQEQRKLNPGKYRYRDALRYLGLPNNEENRKFVSMRRLVSLRAQRVIGADLTKKLFTLINDKHEGFHEIIFTIDLSKKGDQKWLDKKIQMM